MLKGKRARRIILKNTRRAIGFAHGVGNHGRNGEANVPREEEHTGLEELGGLPGGTDAPRPFAPEQMVACDACLRANAPTRMSCLYCGAPLPATKESAALRRPSLKKLEEWEQGFNVVTLPLASESPPPEALDEASSLLRLDAARLRESVCAGRSLPLARASTADEAELIVERLGALGIRAEVFADESLAKRPARARAFDFEDDALVCRTGPDAEPRRVPWPEVALLVTGRIVSRRVEVAERKSGFGGRSEVVEARELASDEAVLDVYAASAGEGFRVMSGGFDYSCLGEAKGLLAAGNFGALVRELRARAHTAAYDEDYARLRPLLSGAWPAAEHTESLGIRRERPGRFNTEAVTTVSNEGQFTRYARLLHLLALRSRAEGL
jgi:hypothetical protein